MPDATDEIDTGPSIDELQENARRANEALRKAREYELEKRTLGSFKTETADIAQRHDELVDRQTSYDTDSKARLFSFGAFTGAMDGTLIWARIDSIYAVEKQVDERFTNLKTVDGILAVSDSPDEVFNEFQRIRFEGSAEQVREYKAELARREEKVKKHEKITPPSPEAAAAEAKLADLIATGPDFRSASAAATYEDEFDDDEDAVNFVQGLVDGDPDALERLDPDYPNTEHGDHR
jgi:hypothetical protein